MGHRFVARVSACIGIRTLTSDFTSLRMVRFDERFRLPFRQRLENSMTHFDYSAPAELFPGKTTRGQRKVGYKRFSSAAEAVRYVIEDLPAVLVKGSLIEVDERRFEANGIRALYDDAAFPLERNAVAS
jgi:hypothetical protein